VIVALLVLTGLLGREDAIVLGRIKGRFALRP
jgi:hypothetical protein